MGRPGWDFQNIVAEIEKILCDKGDVTIQSPAFLIDKDGHRREHDVLVTRRDHLRKFLTAIECRDHARKVGVPALEAFRTKCDSTGINSAVIVSASGFTHSAIKTAKRLNVQCFTLEQIDQLPAATGIPVTHLRRQFTDIEPWYDLVSPAELHEPIAAFVSGQEVTMQWLSKTLEAVAHHIKGPINPNGVGSIRCSANIEPKDAYLVDGNGNRHKVANIVINCTETVECIQIPSTQLVYGSEQNVIGITRATFDIEGVKGDISTVLHNGQARVGITFKSP